MPLLAPRSPFAPGGAQAIDAEICRKLLNVALSRGGDYADLFFEYRAGGGLSLRRGHPRSASRGVSMGVGVRVQKGDATGYAYVEDLELGGHEARGRDRRAHRAAAASRWHPCRSSARYSPIAIALDRPSLDVPGLDKRALLERASKAALAYDPRIIKAEASFAEEVREILIATSDGSMAHDVQPLMRFGVRADRRAGTASARRAGAAAAAA